MAVFLRIALSLVFFLPAVAVAQSFSMIDSLLVLTKTTNFGSVHGYLEVLNNRADTLPMRWVAHKPAACPSQWQFNFDEQNQNYPDVENGDSADFELYTGLSFPQKMIIGLTHNGVADTQAISFTLFRRDSTADSARITYLFRIAQGQVDTNDTASAVPQVTSSPLYLVRNGCVVSAVDNLSAQLVSACGTVLKRQVLNSGDAICPEVSGLIVATLRKGQFVKNVRLMVY